MVEAAGVLLRSLRSTQTHAVSSSSNKYTGVATKSNAVHY